jgi:hypothetical protein
MFYSIECTECERLLAERERMKHPYDLAAAEVRTADGRGAGEYLIMKTLAEEAKVDLDLVETEMVRHQDSHALPELNAPVF